MKEFLLFAVLVFPLLLSAQTKTSSSEKTAVRFCSSNINWTDAKPPLPSGAKIFILEGNPKDSALFTLRLMLPPFYKMSPHTHPVDERVTVLEGAIFTGTGEKLDTVSAKKFTAGCYYKNPAGIVHYAFTESSPVIIQVSTVGPWGINFIHEK